MDNSNIESVTFYKLTPHSTQIFEKGINITPMAISLPKLKFLGDDYRPAWAINWTPKEERVPQPPAAAKDKKITPRRMALRNGDCRTTPFEEYVAQQYQDGKTCAEICELTGKNASAVNGAMGRYNNKMLFKKDVL
jgi:hypothetical protein